MKYISWSFAKSEYGWRSAQRPWTKTKPGNWWSDREQYPNHMHYLYIMPACSRISWSCIFIRCRHLSRALDLLINSNFPSLIFMLLFSLWWVSLLKKVSRLTWQNMCKWKVWCRNINVMNPKSNTISTVWKNVIFLLSWNELAECIVWSWDSEMEIS